MTRPYRTRTDDTWTQARDAYLAGEAAESVCDRFDLGLSIFRKRARHEGWRRTDQDDPAPLDLIDEEEDLTDFDEDEAIDLARRKMLNAAGRGRVDEAMRWGRFLEMLERLEDVAHRRLAAIDAQRPEVAARKAREAQMHGLHSIHPARGPTPHQAADDPGLLDHLERWVEATRQAPVAASQRRTRSSSSAAPAAMAATSGNRTTPLSGVGQVASSP